MNKKTIVSTLITLPLLIVSASPAAAYTVNNLPDFGSCLNPQWSHTQTNVNTQGGHGVIGVGSFSGTDSIYVSGNNAMQCLCADNGVGYQTNWLNASTISDTDINILKNEGWIYIASGSSYGLEDVPFLAKNNTYSCQQAPTPTCTVTPTPSVSETPTPTPTGTLTPTPTNVPGPTATITPQVSAASGLASTGNMALIYAFVLSGATSLILGIVLRFVKRNK